MSFIDEIRRRIRREMERIEREFEETFRELWETFGPEEQPMWDSSGMLEPLYSIYEAEDAYIIRVDLAGGDTSTLHVEAHGNTLTLTCKLERSIRFERWGTVHREISFHQYRKTIRLPPDADVSRLSYRVRGKIVEIIVPKTS